VTRMLQMRAIQRMVFTERGTAFIEFIYILLMRN
jgi:hypothetical protein